MDAFKLKWNERMQHDPYVNFVLNSDERFTDPEPHRIEYWGIYNRKSKKNKGKDIPDDVVMHDGKYYKPHRKKFSERALDRQLKKSKKAPDGFNEVEIIYKTDRLPTQLHDNTRPQSLYKLRYASLR